MHSGFSIQPAICIASMTLSTGQQLIILFNFVMVKLDMKCAQYLRVVTTVVRLCLDEKEEENRLFFLV